MGDDVSLPSPSSRYPIATSDPETRILAAINRRLPATSAPLARLTLRDLQKALKAWGLASGRKWCPTATTSKDVPPPRKNRAEMIQDALTYLDEMEGPEASSAPVPVVPSPRRKEPRGSIIQNDVEMVTEVERGMGRMRPALLPPSPAEEDGETPRVTPKSGSATPMAWVAMTRTATAEAEAALATLRRTMDGK